jgi:hypothetical protein
MLTIREAQMQAFRDARWQAYKKEIRAQVDARLQGERIASRLPLDQLVDIGLNKASDYDIFNADCIVRLTVFLTRYDPESDADWARVILRDPWRHDAEKMDALENAAREHERSLAC